VRKMRQRPGGKEVGKTESGRQLSASLPCLSCEGGVGHIGKIELRRQRLGERKREREEGDQEERKGKREVERKERDRRKEVGKGGGRPGDSSVSPTPV
jgi:hypothetical protein